MKKFLNTKFKNMKTVSSIHLFTTSFKLVVVFLVTSVLTFAILTKGKADVRVLQESIPGPLGWCYPNDTGEMIAGYGFYKCQSGANVCLWVDNYKKAGLKEHCFWFEVPH